MTQIPVLVCHPGVKPPDTGIYYIVAREGLLMHVGNDWVDAVVRVKEFKALEAVPTRATLRLPPIAQSVFAQAVAFFRKVYELHRSEALVLLFYSKDKGWALSVPKQRVSAAYVKWRDPAAARMEGYRCVGSMHSHGSMEASHSYVDIADEAAIDGVHITIGTMSAYPNFSMSGELVVRGERFEMNEKLVEGVTILHEKPGVENPKERTSILDRIVSGWNTVMYSHNPAVLAGWEMPPEWLENVTPPFTRRVSQPHVAADAVSEGSQSEVGEAAAASPAAAVPAAETLQPQLTDTGLMIRDLVSDIYWWTREFVRAHYRQLKQRWQKRWKSSTSSS